MMLVRAALAVAMAATLVACRGSDADPRTPPQPPPDAPDAVRQRVFRIERGLLPGAAPGGRAAPMSLAERMHHHRVPGVSIAVMRGFAVEWSRGYGVVALGGRPVDTETLFQAASVSKPVAAMGALALVQAGLLGLDEDVNVRLTSWRVPPSPLTQQQPVTLRGLLSHTAGTTVHGFGGYPAGRPVPSLVDVLRGAGNSPPVVVDRPPGREVRYSGGGFSIAQQLMVDVARQPFPEVMRRAVLAPLGMHRSTFEQPLPEPLAANAASGHHGDGRLVRGRWHTYPEMAAAGLWTTSAELARFGVELQRADVGLPTRVLGPLLAGHMLARQKGDAGLGIFIEGKGSSVRFLHNGANAGFRSLLIAHESGHGAAILTNADHGDALIQEIVRSIAAEYRWPGMFYRIRSTERGAQDGEEIAEIAWAAQHLVR